MFYSPIDWSTKRCNILCVNAQEDYHIIVKIIDSTQYVIEN